MQRSGGFGAFLFFGADDGWFYGARYLELWSGGEKPQARRPELQGGFLCTEFRRWVDCGWGDWDV